MTVTTWMLFVLTLKLPDAVFGIVAEDVSVLHSESRSRQNDKYSKFPPYPYVNGNDLTPNKHGAPTSGPRCSIRLESALENIRRRQQAKQSRPGLDLDGYSLHQQLRTIPYDMYVTDMKVRLPATSSWVRVDRCLFNPRNASLETRLLFNDLTISGNVNLYRENDLTREPYYNPKAADTCSMILRLRKAGIGFYTEPIRRERGQFNIRTDSYFLEPGFISVYAYGCEPKLKEHRRRRVDEGRHRDELYELDDAKDDLSREMEDIFLKGIRSLLTTYMQKELQPAIKETLMTNLGYTISYGR